MKPTGRPTGRPRSLDDETAEALYQDYCAWQDAVRTLHPKKLCAKYGLNRHTFHDYATRRHKRRRAA